MSVRAKLVDHADASSGHSLNGGTAKVQAQKQYGKITHPTIKQLAVMILGQVDQHGWDNVRLFHTDIKDAFGQLNIRAEDTCLLLSALTEDLTVIHHQGSFGLTHMPPAFAVILRIIEFQSNPLISGAALVFQLTEFLAQVHLRPSLRL
jgi:hypothetical protein